MEIKGLGQIHLKILEALKKNPEGMTIKEIREAVGVPPNEQELFSRRLRELYPYYNIDRIRAGVNTTYRYLGERINNDYDFDVISKKQRARVIIRDGARCQMCGKSPKDDSVKLHIDHRIPRDWGGKTEDNNLWALCSSCNEGKANLYATFENEQMKKIMQYKSVHRRIAELLHVNQGQWVDSDLICFVANAVSWQQDWQKRLRELRYFSLDIESRRVKREKRDVSEYRLNNWTELPEDITAEARKYEKARATRNKGRYPREP